MQLLELCRDGLSPPLPFQRLGALAAVLVVRFDDRSIQVEQGDFGTRGWVEVDTVQTGAFWAERGFEPLKGRGRARFGEKGMDWWWLRRVCETGALCSLFAILRALSMDSFETSVLSSRLRFLEDAGQRYVQCIVCDGKPNVRPATGPGADMVAKQGVYSIKTEYSYSGVFQYNTSLQFHGSI